MASCCSISEEFRDGVVDPEAPFEPLAERLASIIAAGYCCIICYFSQIATSRDSTRRAAYLSYRGLHHFSQRPAHLDFGGSCPFDSSSSAIRNRSSWRATTTRPARIPSPGITIPDSLLLLPPLLPALHLLFGLEGVLGPLPSTMLRCCCFVCLKLGPIGSDAGRQGHRHRIVGEQLIVQYHLRGTESSHSP